MKLQSLTKKTVLFVSACALSLAAIPVLGACTSSTNMDREAETVEAAEDAELTYGDENAVENSADATTRTNTDNATTDDTDERTQEELNKNATAHAGANQDDTTMEDTDSLNETNVQEVD